MRHSPSLPEIVRVDTSTLDSAIAHLVSFLEPAEGGFNYLDATKSVQAAYRGLHDIAGLTAATVSHAGRFGRSYNIEVIKIAAPLAFGRNTRVFQLASRKLPYGTDRLASYRVPFFFVEGGRFYAYFLQPRKNTHFSLQQYGLLATVLESSLLANEFYGQRYDLEIVDVSRPSDEDARKLVRHNLGSVPIWSLADVEAHFHVVDQALNVVEKEHLVSRIRRPLRDPAFTLFD